MTTDTSEQIFCSPAGNGVAQRKCSAAIPFHLGSSTSATAEWPSREQTKVLQDCYQGSQRVEHSRYRPRGGDRKCQQTKANDAQSAGSERTLFLHPPPPGCSARLPL